MANFILISIPRRLLLPPRLDIGTVFVGIGLNIGTGIGLSTSSKGIYIGIGRRSFGNQANTINSITRRASRDNIMEHHQTHYRRRFDKTFREGFFLGTGYDDDVGGGGSGGGDFAPSLTTPQIV